MLARQCGGLLVRHQRGANTRHFVGGNAHPDAGGADQNAELRFAIRHALPDRLREIRIIRGFPRAGPEIRHAQGTLQQKFFERFLQLVARVVRADRDRDGLVAGQRGALALLDEPQQRHDPLLDLIAAVQIDFVRAADRVADIFFERVEGFVEFPEQERFFGRVRIKQGHGVHVAVRHAEDIIRLLHHLRRQHPAALIGNVDAQFLHRLDGIGAGRLAVHRAESGRQNAVMAAALDGLPEYSFGHRTATNVACANEKNGLHQKQ